MSSPAITIYTVLFTLAGRDPSKNKYVDMFYIWLSFLIRNAGLGSMDSVVILIDAPTLDYINSISTLDILSEDITFQLVFDEIKVPANLSEGICSRFTEAPFDSGEYVLFLDLDILIMRSLTSLFQMAHTSSDDFFTMPEGNLSDPYFGGSLLPEGTTGKGFTAGWYLYKTSAVVSVKELFLSITTGCLQNVKTPLYTIDQPFYNAELYLRYTGQKESSLKIKAIDSSILIGNSAYIPNDVLFVNFFGEAGNDMAHFNKLLMMLCLCYSLPAGFKPMSSELREALAERDLALSAAHQAAAPALPGGGHSHMQSQSP